MKIGTFSVVCGTQACQAHCPYCISKMTNTTHGIVPPKDTNWRNLDIACRFAKDAGATTCLITGKGEPTLYPELVLNYLQRVNKYFPFLEIQTNGMEFWNQEMNAGGFAFDDMQPYQGKITEDTLSLWYEYGLTFVSLSIVHPQPNKNCEFMSPKYFYNIWDVVRLLHKVGISVRMNCTMVKGGVDSWKEMKSLIELCKNMGVEQLTMRDVAKPDYATNEIAEWTAAHQIKIPYELYQNTADRGYQKVSHEINGTQLATFELEKDGAVPLLKLNHGATVYDYKGQNVCLNNCITETTNPEEIRQLIFFPDGHLRYSWNYEGAIIL